MSPKAVRNIEAAVVFIGAAATLILVPERYFLPVSGGMLVLGIAGAMGARKYIEKLDSSAKDLESSGRGDEATALRVRRLMLIDVGVAFAIVGLTAFIGMLIVYGD